MENVLCRTTLVDQNVLQNMMNERSGGVFRFLCPIGRDLSE